MTTSVTIEERGNGFPGGGDYVPGEGQLWLIVSIDSAIQTGRAPGASSWIRATAEPADWEDCAEGDEGPGAVVAVVTGETDAS